MSAGDFDRRIVEQLKAVRAIAAKLLKDSTARAYFINGAKLLEEIARDWKAVTDRKAKGEDVEDELTQLTYRHKALNRELQHRIRELKKRV
jgi:hypothetical protein